MGNNEVRADEKRRELRTLIAEALRPSAGDEADRIAEEVMRHSITVTAPDWELPPYELITLHQGGKRGTTSTKPGNVMLDMRKLVTAVANGILTLSGAQNNPDLHLLALLVIWDTIWSCLHIKIGEVEASVLWALWMNLDKRNTVAKNIVQEAVNRERDHFKQHPLTAQVIDDALQNLKRMGCIEELENDVGRWWLREWVMIKFDRAALQ